MFFFSAQELNTDDSKKLSASYENLSDAATSKVLMLYHDQHVSLFFVLLQLISDDKYINT